MPTIIRDMNSAAMSYLTVSSYYVSQFTGPGETRVRM
jgi:hypothetical protein